MWKSDAMRVLGIAVEEGLLGHWRRWFAPQHQPFRVDRLAPELRNNLPPPDSDRRVSAEHRDTFFMYGGTWVWIDEASFRELPASARRALMVERRRVSHPKPSPCWPSRLKSDGDGCMLRWVEAGVRPSRHESVSAATWRRAAAAVPEARGLAGTFAAGSGPNCFGTVMAAAGVVEARSAWMLQEPFSEWLTERAEPVRGTSQDAVPGTVLAWHENDQLAHAAITLGDGWALSKPSQSWSSPTMVWTVSESITTWRLPGTRLSRHRLKR